VDELYYTCASTCCQHCWEQILLALIDPEDEANYFILNFRKKCYKLALMIYLGSPTNRCRDGVRSDLTTRPQEEL